MHDVRFELTHLSILDLKTSALDHSANHAIREYRVKVSILRPQGYEPCALPLRQPDTILNT